MVCGTCGQGGHNAATCGKKKDESTLAPSHTIPKVIATEKLPEDDITKMGILRQKVIEVAKGLMKGRTENVYQSALAVELQNDGIRYSTEETIPIIYRGVAVGYERLDIALISWLNIIIELKATSTDIKYEHYFQVLNYMRYKQYKYGVVINYCQTNTKGVQLTFVYHNSAGDAWIVDIDKNEMEPLTDYMYE